jgi:hypothetical protein
MAARVIPAASELGADYYQPPVLNDVQSMAHNRYWINEMMNQGRQIMDIGPQSGFGRPNFPEPSSPWFAMERSEIMQQNYPYYSQYPWDW